MSTPFNPASPFGAVLSATKVDSLVVDNGNAGKADPGDTLMYTITITNSGDAPATGVNFTDTLPANLTLVPGSVNSSPLAVDDSYANAIGNTRFTVNAANGVLTNDSDPDGNSISIVEVNGNAPVAGIATATTSLGGTVKVTVADGSFVYDPPVGVTATTDTFTYKLSDGSKFDLATVSITISEMVWYVDNAQAVNGDGRSFSPFNSLTPVNGPGGAGDADGPGHYIFVFAGSGPYAGGLQLENNQRLIGQGVNLVVASQTLVTATTPPTIINASGDGISAATNNTISGLNVGNSSGAGISGSGFGTLTVSSVAVNNGTGQALSLNTGTLSAAFTSLSSTGSSATGITLTSVNGSLTSPTTTVSGSALVGIQVNLLGASSAVSFGNTSVSASGGTGVNLVSNTGSVSFGDLDIAPNSGQKALFASLNTGAINATSGTITSVGAEAVQITGTSSVSTTPLGIALDSVSASGAPAGIALNNTSGSFSVNGSGATAGSGGTIQNITNRGASFINATGITLKNMNLINAAQSDAGTPGAGGTCGSLVTGSNIACNAAVHFDTVVGATLMGVLINGSAQQGINGRIVTNLTLNNTTVMGAGNASGEDGIHLFNLLGNSSFINTTVSGSFDNNVRIENGSGVLSSLLVQNSTFSGAAQGSGFFVNAFGTASAAFDVQNSTFSSNFSGGFPTSAADTATLDVSVQGSTFTNNNDAVQVAAVGGANVTFDISNNLNISGNRIGVTIFHGTPSTGSLEGQIAGNTISIPLAVPGNAISLTNSGNGSERVAVTGNTITYGGSQIGISNDSGPGNGSMDVTITGNSITIPAGANALQGIFAQSAVSSTGTPSLCADIGGTTPALRNTVTVLGTVGATIRVRQRFTGTFRLPGFAGPFNSTAAVNTYLEGRNNVTAGTVTSTVTTNFAGGAACIQPTLMALGNDVDSANTEHILRAAAGEGPGGKEAGKLKQHDLRWVVSAAIERWKAVGISDEEIQRLEAVSFEIADLPEAELAVATASKVVLDRRGAGYGWFIDGTANDEVEFENVDGFDLKAGEASPAYRRMDLLTVIMHAYGVALNHDKPKGERRSGAVMSPRLPAGVRRLPQTPFGINALPAGSINRAVVATAATTVPAMLVSRVDTGTALRVVTRPDEVAVVGVKADSSQAFGFKPANRRAELRPRHASAVMSGETISVGPFTLPAGESVTIMFQATINTPVTPAGTTEVCNQGTVTADGGISVLTDDPDTGAANDPTCTQLAAADLAVTKSDSPDPVFAGNDITYTINLTNNGPDGAANVVLTDAVPANTTFVSAAVITGTGWSVSAPAVGGTGNVVFSKAFVANGETAVFQIVVKVDGSTADGTVITNTAAVVSDTPDGAQANNTASATTSVQVQADLAVTKSGAPNPVFAGSNITYTINFTNNGPNAAQSVTVTDAVPANTTFVSAAVTTGTGWSTSAPAVGGTGNVVFSKATVASGETAVFTIVVNVDSTAADGSVITNTATVASTTTDPNAANNTATATTTVIAQADLAVTKTDSPDPVVAGNNLTYTITLVNNGAGNAVNTTVSDAVPAGTTFVSALVVTGSGWATSAPAVGGTGNVVFSKSSVANGETAVFQIVVNVNSGTPGGSVITNTAAAASSTPDPNPGNNTATAMTLVYTAPTIICPAPIVVGNAPNQCAATVTFTVTTTGFPAPTVNCTPPSGSLFPVGTTPVNCTATNVVGSASCSFTVTVNDTQAPTITQCAADLTISTNGASQIALPNLTGEVTATDNCTPAGSLVITQSPAAGTMVGLGNTVVTLTVTDAAGNQATCTATVTVVKFALKDFVAFSSESTTLAANAKVHTGNVGANTSLPDPNGPPDDKIEVELGPNAKMLQPGSSVVGDTIKLRANSQVYNIHYNESDFSNQATILGSQVTPLPLPVLTLPALPPNTPGTTDITVAVNQTSTLAAGSYRNITVMPNATLILTGGTYQVASFDIRANAKILFTAASDVRVKNQIEADANVIIGPSATAPALQASQIVFYVEGTDTNANNTAVQLGPNNTVKANFYAPNGTVWLKSGTVGTGAFIGKQTRIEVSVELTLNSAF